MESLIEFGKIVKPHGFRGSFVTKSELSDLKTLPKLSQLFIGPNVDEVKPYSLLDAAWMPKGWKFTVEGIASDAVVKSLVGRKVFIERDVLAPNKSGEYFLEELLKAQVLDADSNEVVGTFLGAEAVVGQDRWWIQTKPSHENGEDGQFAIPAHRQFIDRVSEKKIWIRNYRELM